MNRKLIVILILALLSISVYASVVYYGPGRAIFLENIIQFANFLELEAISTKKLRVGGEVAANNFQGANIRKNYITIGGFELAGESFTSYVDAAAVIPVDGTGGGPSAFLSCDRSTVSPMEGDGSLLVSKFNSSLGGQGHGCSYSFTLDTAALNQNLVLSFDYLWADVDSANGDFAVFIYDVDNTTLITPSLSAVNEVAAVTNFSTSFAVTDGINYRLIIHQTLSRTGIFDLKIDNLFVGKQSKIEGINVSASGVPSNYVLSSNGSGASSWAIPPLAYSTTNEYFGVSTASQTVIDLGFDVTISNKVNFQLFIDGILFNEGASYDYEFTSISGGLSSEITLTSAIPASLTIRGLYHGAYGTSLSNPMTTAGDLIYGIASGIPARLPIGTEGHVLTVSSGVLAWTASGAGLSNPMTTAEDLIKGGVGGTPARLAVGTNGQVLTVNGSGAVVWASPAASFTNPMTTAEDIIVGGVSGAATRLPKGTNGQVLSIDTGAVTWKTPAADVGFANPMNAEGDIIYGGTAGAATRLAKGTDGDLLTLSSGVPAWSSVFSAKLKKALIRNWVSNWYAVTAPTTSIPAKTWNYVNYDNGVFVAGNTNAAANDGIMTSPDGVLWTPRTTPTNMLVEAIDWMDTGGSGTWVAIGRSGGTFNGYYSTDNGATWTVTNLTTGVSFFAGRAGNGIFLAASSLQTYTSTDGITFSSAGNASASARDVIYAEGKWVLVGTASARTQYSTDNAATWTDGTGVVLNSWKSVAYGNGRFVAVALNSSTADATKLAMYSDDGIAWTPVTTPGNRNWQQVHYIPTHNIFVAVGTNVTDPVSHTIMVSYDNAVTWELVSTLPNLITAPSFAFGQDRMVTVSSSATRVATTGILEDLD